MFVVLITYLKPISEIDAQLADHVRFLDEQYAKGLFLASGRQVPRTGGVIYVSEDAQNWVKVAWHATRQMRFGRWTPSGWWIGAGVQT